MFNVKQLNLYIVILGIRNIYNFDSLDSMYNKNI